MANESNCKAAPSKKTSDRAVTQGVWLTAREADDILRAMRNIVVDAPYFTYRQWVAYDRLRKSLL
jgi:hypothetical protein